MIEFFETQMHFFDGILLKENLGINVHYEKELLFYEFSC